MDVAVPLIATFHGGAVVAEGGSDKNLAKVSWWIVV